MRIGDIARQIEGVELLRGDASVEVDDVVFDSREAGPGALFAALRGAHTDGHDYVESALEEGASAVLVEKAASPLVGANVLVADDTRELLGPVSAEVFGRPSSSLECVGVTGTNGKTTTAWILEQLLGADGSSVGVIGTVSHRWRDHEIPAVNTTPESADIQSLLGRMRDDGVRRVAMEVSSHGLDTYRMRGTALDVGVFTNLSQDHLDFHGTMEAYLAAKLRLFTELLPDSARAGKDPVAVVNADDSAFSEVARAVEEAEGVRLVTFGEDPRADFQLIHTNVDVDRSAFSLDTPGGRVQVEMPLIGDFNIMNAVAALTSAQALGISPMALVDALAALPQIPGRMERVAAERGPSVFVDYAHSPDALRRALDALQPLCRGELTVVFGAGGDRDRGKRPRMGEVARAGADRVFVTSDNPRSESPLAIIDEILAGCGESVSTLDAVSDGELSVDEDRESAIQSAIGSADDGDIVLIAGKGHEIYQEIRGERRSFDDREVARAALEATTGSRRGRRP